MVETRLVELARDGSRLYEGFLAVPDAGRKPAVLILSEMFGLNGPMRDFARHYAGQGHPVLVPDLFWRTETPGGLDYDEKGFALSWARIKDFDVDTCCQVELHQCVHGLVVGIDNIEDALVRARFVLVTRVLVGMRRSQDRVALDLGRQRNRTTHLRARTLGCFHDLARRTIDQAMIERLEPNPNLLVRHCRIPQRTF